jgi:hypothetical protein
MSRSYVMFEKIGTCEQCGLTDHHLIEGECPFCRPKVTVTLCSPQLLTGAQCGRANVPVRPFLSLSVADRDVIRVHIRAAISRAIAAFSAREEVPLGAEASVSHVRVPKGRAR